MKIYLLNKLLNILQTAAAEEVPEDNAEKSDEDED